MGVNTARTLYNTDDINMAEPSSVGHKYCTCKFNVHVQYVHFYVLLYMFMFMFIFKLITRALRKAMDPEYGNWQGHEQSDDQNKKKTVKKRNMLLSVLLPQGWIQEMKRM